MSDEDANDDVADADDSYNLQCGSSRSLIWLDFTMSVTESSDNEQRCVTAGRTLLCYSLTQ